MISPSDVAVIVPVKNRPALLVEALSSILSGTCMPAETIVVLDGQGGEKAADEKAAANLADAFERRGSVLTMIPGPSRGPGAARNAGAERAKGEWLAFLDSDDLWRADKLAEQIEFLRTRPHLHACHTTETWIKNGKEIPVPLSLRPVTGRPLRESFRRCLVSASSVMIRRSVFFELDGFDPCLAACEDFDLWIRFFLKRPMGLVTDSAMPLVIKRSGDWDQLSATRSMDLYRVQSLIKILSQEQLDAADRQAAVTALQEKWEIINGQFLKHGYPTRETLEGMRTAFEMVTTSQ